MKRFAVLGKTSETKAQLRKELEAHHFIYDETNPDIVLSYGGDGTYIIAEHTYPGIPKVLIRDSKICYKCHNIPTEHVLTNLAAGKYAIQKHAKIQAQFNNKTYVGVNEATIRNKTPVHALRFELRIDDKKINHEYIGDGIIISTSFGSTGYYYSVTRHTFTKGLGIAFNNTTIHHDHLLVDESSTIHITITRGEGILAIDHEMINVTEGDIITITKSKQFASIIQVTGN